MSMDNPAQPLVSIITVNYNQAEVTCGLLDSLKNATYPNIEIIVVDNASTKGDSGEIKNLYPYIIFIKSATNLGFAGGNNLGVEAARGKYLLFLNNDTEVEPVFIEPLVGFLEANPGVGMVSPKIRYYYLPDTIQYAGYTAMHPILARNNLIGYKQRDNGQYNELRETSYAHGAAMMVPRTVIEKAGTMDDGYFLYYEELDWAEAIKRAGYQIFYIPQSVVMHKESVSTGKQSPLMVYYKNRNRVRFVRRNFKGINKIICLIYLFIIVCPKDAVTFSLKGKVNLGYQIIRAYCWNLTHK